VGGFIHRGFLNEKRVELFFVSLIASIQKNSIGILEMFFNKVEN
jgi:hypothetical protein